MQSVIEIERLSREEKLQVMEAIWEDLSRDEAELESPDWHKEMLLETSRRLEAGQERIMDWHDAKKELRNRFE
ncbi:MAG: addiction module protein [Nitrospirae bacterium]|nr:addiction module protein [Nitrospirota bacterium]